jgi:imidazolonepropionase-like amidohydrolase
MSRTILYPDSIIDGTGAEAIDDHAVVVRDGVVEAVLPVGQVGSDDGDNELRLTGCTLIPGLINNHVHLELPGDNTPFTPWIDLQSDAALAIWAAHNARVSLLSGVTTVRDCGGRGTTVFDVRQAQREGRIEAARIVSCGWTLTITGGHTRHFGGEVDGVVGVQRAVRDVISRGAEYVKVMAAGGGTPGSLPQYPSFTKEELTAIVEMSHSMGRKVSAHCIATASIENAVDAGVDMIEHASFYGPDQIPQIDQRVAEKLAGSGIPVTPTLQVARDMYDIAMDAGGDVDPVWERRLETQRGIIAALRELGVPLLAGSDAGWRATAFDTLWKELEELTFAGMSPVEVIHAATGAVSALLGYGDSFGTIEPGRAADLVAVRGDLSSDIRVVQNVALVMQGGQMVVRN